MNRRDNLKLLLAGSVGAALPARAFAGNGERVFVFDGRFAVARGMAGRVPLALDCQHDAAALWFASLKEMGASGPVIDGLTTPADALVLADFASRDGLRFVALPGPLADNRLVEWIITRRPIRS
jgi:hypothetical protein